jgi:hypothetical protein
MAGRTARATVRTGGFEGGRPCTFQRTAPVCVVHPTLQVWGLVPSHAHAPRFPPAWWNVQGALPSACVPPAGPLPTGRGSAVGGGADGQGAELRTVVRSPRVARPGSGGRPIPTGRGAAQVGRRTSPYRSGCGAGRAGALWARPAGCAARGRKGPKSSFCPVREKGKLGRECPSATRPGDLLCSHSVAKWAGRGSRPCGSHTRVVSVDRSQRRLDGWASAMGRAGTVSRAGRGDSAGTGDGDRAPRDESRPVHMSMCEVSMYLVTAFLPGPSQVRETAEDLLGRTVAR